jgi:GNAT superfamily N-acetyltransferase
MTLMNTQTVRTRIRLARTGDSHALARMRYAFRAETGAVIETEVGFQKRCEPWMKKHLRAKNSWRCWIAESRENFLGNVWVQLIEKIPNPVSEGELHGYITNLYVIPKARGKGVGSKLLRAALNWCRTKKVDVVFLWPSQRSRALYLRHDFAIAEDVFELRGGKNSKQ